MYCKQCGAEIASDATFCPICGAKVDGSNQTYQDDFTSYSHTNAGPENLESLTIWAFVLSFFQPIIGLILGIIANNRNYGPRNKKFAKASIIIASIYIAVSLMGVILVLIFILILCSGGVGSQYIDIINNILIK